MRRRWEPEPTAHVLPFPPVHVGVPAEENIEPAVKTRDGRGGRTRGSASGALTPSPLPRSRSDSGIVVTTPSHASAVSHPSVVTTGGGPRIAPAIIPFTPFGKYTLVARLGRGGMAEVFLGFVSGPAGFRKPLVIKRILPDLESEPRLVDMFFDEARLAARLGHPHVVQTYEVGAHAGSHYLAMEYLEGQAFNQVLRRCLSDG